MKRVLIAHWLWIAVASVTGCGVPCGKNQGFTAEIAASVRNSTCYIADWYRMDDGTMILNRLRRVRDDIDSECLRRRVLIVIPEHGGGVEIALELALETMRQMNGEGMVIDVVGSMECAFLRFDDNGRLIKAEQLIFDRVQCDE